MKDNVTTIYLIAVMILQIVIAVYLTNNNLGKLFKVCLFISALFAAWLISQMSMIKL